jgi:hypothetical protein
VANNKVQQNYIGLNAAGTAALGNATGIEINSASSNVLGGIGASYRNFISGNSRSGILVHGAGATANEARNNQVGLKPDNTTLKNGGTAIRVFDGGRLKLSDENQVRA